MARLVDIAREAGVSTGLVSRVLNNDPAVRIADDTRQRVREVAARLGYQPHYAARALKLARTNTIALVVPTVTNVIFSHLLSGVEETAQQLGYTLLLARSESLGDQRQLSRLVDEGRVDGFLIQGRDDETLEALGSRIGTAPAVVVNARLPDRPGSVMVDDSAAADLAARHLIEHGHRRLALVNGLTTSETARRRGLGFADALREFGLDPDAAPVTHQGYDPASAAPAIAEIASLPISRRPTGIVVANLNAALAALTALRRQGMSVPDDVSVVALHDGWTADHSWPPVSTVRLPVKAQGRQAMTMLHAALGGLQISDLVLTTPEPVLVERDSVRRPAEGG